MSTTALIPVSEYLKTTYRPDCDYIDGEVRERNMGEQPHARLQGYLTALFFNKRVEWNIRPLPEQRLQVTPTRFRIPDVMVIRRDDPDDRIITFAPLLCIEVLSSDDRLGDVQERVDDYVRLGVRDIWVIDPWKRLAYEASSDGFRRATGDRLRVQGTPIEVGLAELFLELD